MRKLNIKMASLITLAGVAALFAPHPVFGALINNSQLNIAGDTILGTTFLNWKCDLPGDPACASSPANQGDFSIVSSTGTFAQYNGTFGLITDIGGAQPLNTLFSLPNFMTFDLNSNETIALTFIPLGNDPASSTCAGLEHCTPQSNALITPNNPLGLSAFNLDMNSTGTAVVFSVSGVVHDISGATAPIGGIYTAQFQGETPQQVLAAIASGAGSTYSSNLLLTTVPEAPDVMLSFMGIGLVGIGLINRGFRKTK